MNATSTPGAMSVTLQLAMALMSCMLPSEKVPVAVNCCVVALAMVGERGAKVSPVTRSEISAHLLLQVVVPLSKSQQAVVSNDLLARWGVGPETAFHAAGENLRRASEKGWGMMAESPGVYFSTWNDGFDAARLAFPRVFAHAPLRGRAVALAPSTRALAFAGSDDEEGLFHLARRMWRSVRRIS
jgi:hypothetical protein